MTTTIVTPCIFDGDHAEKFSVKSAFFHGKALRKISDWILNTHNLKIEWHYSKSQDVDPYYLSEEFIKAYYSSEAVPTLNEKYDSYGLPFVRFVDGDDDDLIGILRFTQTFDRYNLEDDDDNKYLLTIDILDGYDLTEDSPNHPSNYGGKLPF